MPVKIGLAIGAGYFGFHVPNMFVQNSAQRRQTIKSAFPLGMPLICVQSGISIEAAFQKVASEAGGQSLDLAGELLLPTAEPPYLRRHAFENLGACTGTLGIKAVSTALIQAERKARRSVRRCA